MMKYKTMILNDKQSYFFANDSEVPLKQTKGTSQIGLQSGWTRVTFILKQAHLQRIKTVAKEKRITIKKLVHIILTNYLLNYQGSTKSTGNQQ